MPDRMPRGPADPGLLDEIAIWLLQYRFPTDPSYWNTDPDNIIKIEDGRHKEDNQNEHRIERLFDIIRSEIKREDDLIDQRNTWCILISAGVLAAIGAIYAIDMRDGISRAAALAFGFVLIVAAARISLLCGRAVTAARMQIEYLFSTYSKNRELFEEYGFPRPFGRRAGHESGIKYSQVTPLAIFYLWLIIGVLWSAISIIELFSSGVMTATSGLR